MYFTPNFTEKFKFCISLSLAFSSLFSANSRPLSPDIWFCNINEKIELFSTSIPKPNKNRTKPFSAQSSNLAPMINILSSTPHLISNQETSFSS